jgi:hypothetical protein
MDISVTAWKSTSRKERQGSGIRQTSIIRRRVGLRCGGQEGNGTGLGIKPALQDEDGGDLVDEAAGALVRAAGGGEGSLSFGGGEALVPEVDGEDGAIVLTGLGSLLMHEGLELLDKGVDAPGLAAAVAGEMEGVADDESGAAVAAGEAEDGALVAAGGGALEGHERLGDAQRVREGDADATGADIETEPGLPIIRHSAHHSPEAKAELRRGERSIQSVL